jgi:hypothetical protein
VFRPIRQSGWTPGADSCNRPESVTASSIERSRKQNSGRRRASRFALMMVIQPRWTAPLKRTCGERHLLAERVVFFRAGTHRPSTEPTAAIR